MPHVRRLAECPLRSRLMVLLVLIDVAVVAALVLGLVAVRRQRDAALAVSVALLAEAGAADVGRATSARGTESMVTSGRGPAAVAAAGRSPARQVEVIEIEIRNAVELAAARTPLARPLAWLSPGLLRSIVHRETVKLMREQMAANGVDAAVELRRRDALAPAADTY